MVDEVRTGTYLHLFQNVGIEMLSCAANPPRHATLHACVIPSLEAMTRSLFSVTCAGAHVAGGWTASEPTVVDKVRIGTLRQFFHYVL